MMVIGLEVLKSLLKKLEYSLGELCDEPGFYYLDVCDAWRSMYKGQGAFSGFYIHRDGFDERLRLNQYLDNITSNI